MIKLVELAPQKNIEYKIFLDMDGVLTDFDKSFYDLTGYKDGRTYEDEFGSKTFWDVIGKEGIKYWSEMPWTLDGKKLWNYVKDKNVQILSAPAKTIPESKKGKLIWLARELSPKPKINLVKAVDKQKFADKYSILIDDYEKNIGQWKSSGGIPILHTSATNTINKLKKMGI